jgi:hypothetical protein
MNTEVEGDICCCCEKTEKSIHAAAICPVCYAVCEVKISKSDYEIRKCEHFLNFSTDMISMKFFFAVV